jgi:ribosome maturation factor RimP
VAKERLDTLASALEPHLAELGLDVYDVELVGPERARIVRVAVDRAGGVDLEAISAATEALSKALDELAPANLSGPYTLEVSSPGLERQLRTVAHFRGALSATVSVKFRDGESARRCRGVLLAVDDAGIELETEGERRHVNLDDILQARTVFEWGDPTADEPGPKRRSPSHAKQKVQT